MGQIIHTKEQNHKKVISPTITSPKCLMWCRVISIFYAFCRFWSVAINIVDNFFVFCICCFIITWAFFIIHFQQLFIFLADWTIRRAFGSMCLLSVCRLWRFVLWRNGTYILAKKCLKERIGNQGQKVDFGVAAIFLLPVSALRPPWRPLLPYFLPVQPSNRYYRWYKWTF